MIETKQTRPEDPSRFVWPALIAAIVLAGIALLAAKPVYVHFRRIRAEGLVIKGEKALAEQRIDDAGKCLKSALSLASRSPAVLRFAAHYCTTTGLPDALGYWEMLLGTSQATLSDK
ncbi:MAG TPA: hypothetical protein VMF06_05320, partial [Candidatus Limnocylindria bacterium]|nr:hypothetical protein [Candidatus Limnocylindria bacterium]